MVLRIQQVMKENIGQPSDDAVTQAAWVARRVGLGASHIGRGSLTALALSLQRKRIDPGSVIFRANQVPSGVWVIREGHIELAVGSGPRRAVAEVLRPGDVAGDTQLLLGIALPYTARNLTRASCLFIDSADLRRLLTRYPAITRPWIASCASRLVTSNTRLLHLLAGSLHARVARLLIVQAVDGVVPLAQHVLAAMLGVGRPSLNKTLKELERRQLVGVGYRAVRILNRPALVRLAGWGRP